MVGHSKSVVCALSRGAEDFWMKVRPHPGPLPREREKRALASEVADPPGRCERWGAIRGDAVPAKDELLLAQVMRRALPLPGGEGRGEGGPASLHEPVAANRLIAEAGATIRIDVPLTFPRARTFGSNVIRQRMGCPALKLAEDAVPDDLSLAPESGVPEAKHFDTARGEELLPFGVMPLLFGKSVLASVQFNGKACFFAEEIEKVGSDGVLAPELVATEAASTQPAPHEFFGPSRFFAECASSIAVCHEESDSGPGSRREVGSRTALTPSLSPGERGKRASVVGHSKSVVCALSRGAEDFWIKVRPHPALSPREREESQRRSPLAHDSCPSVVEVFGQPSPRPSPPGEGEARTARRLFRANPVHSCSPAVESMKTMALPPRALAW